MKKEKKLKTSNHSVPNLERALKIFELLSNHPEGLNITEISNHLEIPKNSTFRITTTLLNSGYLFRDEKSKAFSITGKLLSLGYAALSESTLIEKSIDVMKSLRDELKETVLLGIMVNHEGIVLELVPGLHSIKFWVDVGTIFPSNTAAPSKAMISFMSEQQQEEILGKMEFKKFTKNTITSVDKYRDLLEKVKMNGYGCDLGEEVEGVNCVSAPIFNRNGTPIAAIWVTGPAERLTNKDSERIGSTVKNHAIQISKRFGYYPEKI